MNGAGLAVFLVLYFRGFWVQGSALLRIALALVGLGVVLSPYNMGASAFFIYGAAFLGDAAPARRRGPLAARSSSRSSRSRRGSCRSMCRPGCRASCSAC